MEFKYMLAIGIFVMGSFALQYFLGWKQISYFGEEYKIMRREGRVGIGRRPGKITAGTLILFSLDDSGKIRYGRKLQGSTVWAKFKDFNVLNGKNLSQITKEDPEMKNEIRITRLTVLNAVQNYQMVMEGKVIPPKDSLFGGIANHFKRKVKA